MRALLTILLCALVAPPVTLAKSSESERKRLEAWARSLDEQSIHKAVQEHERDPLGDHAKEFEPVLMIHFELLDYIVCLDQIGFLLDTKNKAHEAVFWQVVFGSGDFVEQHPDQATDKFAYMLAGLESGLRAYENILVQKPKARLDSIDKLVTLRNEGQLLGFVKAKPCDKM